MVPGSHLKSVFVAHRDADCEGSWSECTALCEAANERAWTETAAQVGGGAACPEATDCQPGDGGCIGDTSDTQPCVDLNSNCDSLVATFGCERSLEPVVSGTGADICPATCGACGEAEPGASTSITIGIQTMQFANEISWNLDGGPEFPQEPYADNTQTNHGPITLTEGEHTLFYFDSYGDGRNGGYWTITGPNGEVIAGGETDGQVEGAGGEDIFCVSSSAHPRPHHVCHICSVLASLDTIA